MVSRYQRIVLNILILFVHIDICSHYKIIFKNSTFLLVHKKSLEYDNAFRSKVMQVNINRYTDKRINSIRTYTSSDI